MALTMFGRTIRKVGVIGSRNMGPDIALHFSQSLYSYHVPVVVVDNLQAALDEGSKKTELKVAKAAEKGAFKKEAAEAILKNLLFTRDYANLADADLVVEAGSEDVNARHNIFNQLEKICPNTAIFASNSSHAVPEDIFEALNNKGRCLVVHYFFPAESNIWVEIVPGRTTDPALAEYLMNLYEFIGKAPTLVKSRWGFVGSTVFEGLFEATALTVEQGHASLKEADAIAAKALGMNVGPFAAHNLVDGNSVTRQGLTGSHTQIMPWYGPPGILDDRIKSGKPWETAGRGELVRYSPEMYEAVSKRVIGAYSGMITEIVDSGISSIGDV